ncbi:ubiquinol-cytochrome c reductase iron-sulfur subunit [Acidocella sp.]|jgi:ubiquinol-cytochrome c reductase iron-sulfur subunit|uniref:ubiquinol-cytochrome c reductase iron-sulfur subunit n=1 Tax=Acidocella sp. TaxID=50710 RepID=UPI0026228C35|nr:ubiquinol-cytochrome c reductase iron-sulfur subunit [Acidocella sp.]
MAETATTAEGAVDRRDFLTILAGAGGLLASAAIAWPLIDALAPHGDAAAGERMIVTISDIAENSAITVYWAGLPIYVRKLTAQQISANQNTVPSTLPDPATYAARVQPGYESFVVVVGLNTATPCMLEGNAATDPRGPFDGWLSPCDGSAYDPLGRVRAGPARRNLAIPPYKFLNANQIQLG